MSGKKYFTLPCRIGGSGGTWPAAKGKANYSTNSRAGTYDLSCRTKVEKWYKFLVCEGEAL